MVVIRLSLALDLQGGLAWDPLKQGHAPKGMKNSPSLPEKRICTLGSRHR